MHDTLDEREERFIRDRLHKLNGHLVERSCQFENQCIVFEDLKEICESIDYGMRTNRRLHHLPFRVLQYYTSYKPVFEGVPTAWIDPEYTSQQCSMCDARSERITIKKMRRQASGSVDTPIVTSDTARGHYTDGIRGVFD